MVNASNCVQGMTYVHKLLVRSRIWIFMKRLFKFIAYSFGCAAVIFLLCLLGVWGVCHNVVRVKAGAMRVNETPGELGAQVNPFSGTGGFLWLCPHNSPAATTPFGMVRLAPDTASLFVNDTGINRSGYYYADNKIIGFSHTRLVGADAKEGGAFRIMPTVESRAEKMRAKGRFARFSHRDETAFPGYYAVRLPKDDVLVELTATPRVGVHRYTFNKNEAPHLLLDATSAIGDRSCEDGVLMIKKEVSEIEGKMRATGSFSGRYGGLDVYFVARFSKPFTSIGVWNGDRFTAGGNDAAGKDIGADLTFERANGPNVIEVRLAISYVSIANARANLDAEASSSRGFDAVYAAARDAWEGVLSRIRVDGGTETQRRIFYTALYRAFMMPTIFTDVNGEYMGFDRTVHKAEGFQYYTDFSLWDTFRTVQPLYNIIARGEERDMMRSLVEMAKAGGCLPRWPSGCGYTNCMFGTPADVAVSEAYLKGIRDFDIDSAYNSMRQLALTGPPSGSKFGGRDGLDGYLQSGYCTSDKTKRCVAKTLEYSWSDNSLSLLARALGKNDDADLFARHALNYRNTWNPETKHFEEKDSSGTFAKEHNFARLSFIDPSERYTRGYVEGSGEQWRWAVPYDPDGLISLFGGRDYFISELERYFEKARSGVGRLPNGYYWHGNEPFINAAFLFNAAGRPDLTQKWVRWIMDEKYSDDSVGLDGNDDGGTLSSWYVMNALGFYPIAGGTRYELGSPLFDKAVVKIDDKLLAISAGNDPVKNRYVSKVVLNGAPLERPSFTHDQIAQGGTLQFEMSPTPVVAESK
jgi:predicted alpha-1,2-mannosidase